MSTPTPFVPHPGLVGIAGTRAALTWRFSSPTTVLSSAAVGGGIGTMDWVANVGVVSSYDRTDLDHHAAEVATALGLTGPGATLFTAVDVARVVTACDGGVRVDATVGVTRPVWAAAPSTTDDTATPGTINLVIQVPATITAAAGVNAVVTATEAKTQALVEYGIDGSGTASDAVAVCWPSAGTAVRFAGPRSTLGAAIARAVHRAVCDGLDPGPHQ